LHLGLKGSLGPKNYQIRIVSHLVNRFVRPIAGISTALLSPFVDSLPSGWYPRIFAVYGG
jgi:hypothetical protein